MWLKRALKKRDFLRPMWSQTRVALVGEGASGVKGLDGCSCSTRVASAGGPGRGFLILSPNLALSLHSHLIHLTFQVTVVICVIPQMSIKYKGNCYFCFSGGRVGSDHWLMKHLCYQSKPSLGWLWKGQFCFSMSHLFNPGSIKSEFLDHSDSTNILFYEVATMARSGLGLSHS